MDKDLEEMHAKVAAIQAKNAQAREQNRLRFPEVTAFVDALNGVGLGPVKVLRITGVDGSLLLGKPDTEQWIPWRIYEPPRVVRSKGKK